MCPKIAKHIAPLFSSILKALAVSIHRCSRPPTAKADKIYYKNKKEVKL
ncbi:MAG: hypothetical protein II984_05240 [Clostridia bacterium]|nr:hypothetical protein [Clostridia bacterium]